MIFFTIIFQKSNKMDTLSNENEDISKEFLLKSSPQQQLPTNTLQTEEESKTSTSHLSMK